MRSKNVRIISWYTLFKKMHTSFTVACKKQPRKLVRIKLFIVALGRTAGVYGDLSGLLAWLHYKLKHYFPTWCSPLSSLDFTSRSSGTLSKTNMTSITDHYHALNRWFSSSKPQTAQHFATSVLEHMTRIEMYFYQCNKSVFKTF